MTLFLYGVPRISWTILSRSACEKSWFPTMSEICKDEVITRNDQDRMNSLGSNGSKFHEQRKIDLSRIKNCNLREKRCLDINIKN